MIPALLRVCCAAGLSYQSFTHLSVVGVVVVVVVLLIVVAVVGSGSNVGSVDMDSLLLNFTLVGV